VATLAVVPYPRTASLAPRSGHFHRWIRSGPAESNSVTSRSASDTIAVTRTARSARKRVPCSPRVERGFGHRRLQTLWPRQSGLGTRPPRVTSNSLPLRPRSLPVGRVPRCRARRQSPRSARGSRGPARGPCPQGDPCAADAPARYPATDPCAPRRAADSRLRVVLVDWLFQPYLAKQHIPCPLRDSAARESPRDNRFDDLGIRSQLDPPHHWLQPADHHGAHLLFRELRSAGPV
jgi:hypothetical protein